MAPGIASAMRSCSHGGIARSRVVTTTDVGTSMCRSQRFDEKLPTATPASMRWRTSCRRISAAAHARRSVGRAPLPRTASLRSGDSGGCATACPIRVVPAAADITVVKIMRSRKPGTMPALVAHSTMPDTR